MKNAELGKEYYMILLIFIKQCCIYRYIGYGFIQVYKIMKSKMCSEL